MKNLFLVLLCLFLSLAFARPQLDNYAKIKSTLNSLNQANPQFTELTSLGKNDQGVDIVGIKIYDKSNSLPKVSHLIVGTHHGNEGKAADLTLSFIAKLIDILKDPTEPLYNVYKNYIIHAIPVLNISGYNTNNRYEKTSTGGSVDPNRDYPDPCGKNASYSLKSTSLLSKYIDKENIIGTVTVHGFIGTFTYPWGTYAKNPKSPDDAFYSKIALKAVSYNNYETGTHTEVIYPTVGAYEDWAYHAYGVWSMLLELSYSANFNNDSDALLAYFSLLPAERSNNHETGPCQKGLTREQLLRSRP